MASAGVGGDGEQRIAARGDETCAGGEVDAALLADGVLRAVAVGAVVQVVEERVGGLVAFEIDDAERLAAQDFTRPTFAGRQREIVDREFPELLQYLKCVLFVLIAIYVFQNPSNTVLSFPL